MVLIEDSFVERYDRGLIHLPTIEKIAFKHKFLTCKTGIEYLGDMDTNATAIENILKKDETRLDPVSHSFRFSVDLFFINIIDYRAYKAELKWTDNKWNNYDMELDSFKGVLNESRRREYTQNKVFLILTTNTKINACWIEDIHKLIHTVIVPSNRWNKDVFEKIKTDYKDTFPNCEFKYKPILAGSGTPFLLFNKEAKPIKPLELFLDNIKEERKWKLK